MPIFIALGKLLPVQVDFLPSQNTFPIAALWPHASDSYWLPHEAGYRERIVTVTKT